MEFTLTIKLISAQGEWAKEMTKDVLFNSG